ncbi:tetratricopeptide repeat protein [Myxococcota bacterium]|nr:tetratricopeptide repeat protein [Myxococcota bacterium]
MAKPKLPRFRVLAALALTGVLATPVSALAQPAKKGDAADAKAKKEPSGPALKYEQFRKQTELKVAEKREEQIAGLQRLLDLGPKEKEIPDIKFRLAELYYEKSRFYFFRGQEAEDKIPNAKSPSEKQELEAESKRHQKDSKAWVRRALDIYKEIRDRFPKYERMPEVLFALGQSYWSEGQYQSSIEVYADLIRNFKDSPLVAEAWIAFGEFYFNEGDVNKALKSYEKAAEDKRSRVYGFALYKQAWCYYNLSEWKKALSKFKATVFYSQMADQMSGENRISLGREAQKDFVRTYVHVGDASRARFELADLVGKDECNESSCLGLLEQLAGLWYDGGYFDESAELYGQLIKLKNDNPRNPFYQQRIVDLVSKGGDKQKVINETRRLIEILAATKDAVSRMSGDAKTMEKARADVAEADQSSEAIIRKLAQLWNIEAKKTRQPKTYEYAKSMYTDYLRLYPGSQFTYEMRFQLGDLYYKLEMFKEAAESYEATVKADPKGQYLVPAANDNILAVEEHLKDIKLPKPKQVDKPSDIPKEKMALVEACDRYAQLVPKDKADKLVAVMYKAAKVYYDYNHFDEAEKRFDFIVSNHPADKEAEFAANLVIDVQNLRENWKKLYEYASRYLKSEPLVAEREKLQKDLSRFSEYAKFKLVQILEQDITKGGGDPKQVAQAYTAFYEEFPKSENADKALFNASVVWDKLGDKAQANKLRAKLLKEFPSSPLGADVAFYVAKSNEERTAYDKAAELYAEFAKKYPDDKRARDALYNAAIFFAGTGKVKEANKLREEYLAKYGLVKEGAKEAAAIYYSTARDLELAGKWADAANRYADFVKKFPDAPQIWDALWNESSIRREKLRQVPAADKIDGVILGTYEAARKKGVETPREAALYASLIAFARIEKDFADYKKKTIVTPNLNNPAPFQRSLEEKAKAREKVVGAYTQVVTKYQQADSTIAALYKIAESWDEFVNALGKVPCPRGITEDVCALIKQDIEQNKLGPAREAAFAAYKTCVSKSNELNVFTPYSTKCVKALETLAPDQYPPIAERRVDYVEPSDRVQGVRSTGLILKHNGFSPMPAAGSASQVATSVGDDEPGDEPEDVE